MRNRPQDGAWRALVNGRLIDVRLSTLPTVHGEKLVMRVIDSHARLKTLEALGYDPENLARLQRALARPDGLVLVTGPTGSGKTTVLYAALNQLRNGRTNIVTVEDPVERHVEGVNQIAVNGRGGNTFSAVLRAVMRQDRNVIMVGEIRSWRSCLSVSCANSVRIAGGCTMTPKRSGSEPSMELRRSRQLPGPDASGAVRRDTWIACPSSRC